MPIWKAILAVVLGVVVAAAASWPSGPKPPSEAEPVCCCGTDACCCDAAPVPETGGAGCGCSCDTPDPVAPEAPRPSSTPVSFWLLPLPAREAGVESPRTVVAPAVAPPATPDSTALTVHERLALFGVRTT